MKFSDFSPHRSNHYELVFQSPELSDDENRLLTLSVQKTLLRYNSNGNASMYISFLHYVQLDTLGLASKIRKPFDIIMKLYKPEGTPIKDIRFVGCFIDDISILLDYNLRSGDEGVLKQPFAELDYDAAIAYKMFQSGCSEVTHFTIIVKGNIEL